MPQGKATDPMSVAVREQVSGPAARAPQAASQRRRSRQGVICGVLSYGLWGLIPLYFKLVSSVPPAEVLAHRVCWSFVLLALVVTLLGRWGDVRRGLRTRGVQHQERKTAVARDEAQLHSSATSSSARRDGRRRITPRWAVRMNSTR